MLKISRPPLHDEHSLLAHVEEGLGTKNLVADAMLRLTGKNFYAGIAQDAVAMIVNDLITLGMKPLTIAMHLAVGSSDWFKNEERSAELIRGWEQACRLARCVWSCGETPTLRDVVHPATCMLSGSAIGIGRKHFRMGPDLIRDGDAILLLGSSGIHANGLTLARDIAFNLSTDKSALDGYLMPLPDDTIYGEVLLKTTPIYVTLVERLLQSAGAHYAVNITGHGWRKLMRAPIDAEYVIEKLPKPQPIFRFLQAHCPKGRMSDRDAYGDFNMGAGFAIYIDPDSSRALAFAKAANVEAMIAGHVKFPSKRQVTIKPLNITFDASTLGVR